MTEMDKAAGEGSVGDEEIRCTGRVSEADVVSDQWGGFRDKDR